MGGVSRDQVALQPPGARALAGFPLVTIAPDTEVFRGHRRTLGPWFFSGSGAGRFDLDGGRGTCYLAVDAATAVREVLGAALHQLGFVSTAFAAERVISRLRLPTAREVADLCDGRAAEYGVTREIHTLTPYDTTRAWATALDAIAGGVRYASRFTTGPAANALAVFDTAGPASWPPDSAPVPFAMAARHAGLTVAGPPRTVTIVQPPAP